MNKKCNRCNWEIAPLNLTEKQRLEIWSLLNQDLKLFAIQELRQSLKINLTDAKGIVLHLNKEFGKCIRCNFEDLKEEKMECPKCKSFNYNLKIYSSFNQEFCSHLAWELDFDELDNERVKGFWCDGVDHIPSDIKSLFKANFEKNKVIRTNAWIGKDGQDIYQMEISFGEISIRNYLQNKSLIDCIPQNNFKDWIEINPNSKTIKAKLK